MLYTEEQLKKIHDIELDILSEIIRVCDQLDIKWFTISGTTLGAIRHNGFIPWDDDIDIGMLRDDYDKFLANAPELLSKCYSLCHYPLEKNYPLYFAKVRRNDTLFVEKALQKKRIHHGIYVDIFPFDKVPDDTAKREKQRKHLLILSYLFLSKSLWGTTQVFSSPSKQLRARVIRSIIRILLLPVPKKFIFNQLLKTTKKYNDSDCKAVAIKAGHLNRWEISDIFPTQPHQFENITVQIPNSAHKVLAHEYGDYMKFPPEDKRVAHAPVKLQF